MQARFWICLPIALLIIGLAVARARREAADRRFAERLRATRDRPTKPPPVSHEG